MNAVEPPSFETNDHERIYEHVEQRGAVSPNGLHTQVQLESGLEDGIVADLEREGFLTEFDGELQLALGVRSETTHQLDGTVVTIRAARQEDLPAVVDTIRQVIAEMLYPSAEILHTSLTRDGVLKRHNDAETRIFFVPTVDDQVIGWVHVGASTLQRVRRTAELTLGVGSGYRERGIGSQLLAHGCEWAASNSYQKACQRLPTADERARSFLDSHHWETETIRRNHYDRDGEQIDEVVRAIEL